MPPQELDYGLPDDENDQPKNIWSMVEAYLLIESFVKENQSLKEVHEYFFSNAKEKINQKDLDFIERVYIEQFWISAPEKGKRYINDVINKMDKNLISNWVASVYGNESDEKFLKLFVNASFFEALKIVFEKMDESKVLVFLQKMRKYFRIAFLEATSLDGFLGIFRCLLFCNSKTKRSKVFCDASKNLWLKLFGDNEVLDLKIEIEDVHMEHSLLASLVDRYIPNDDEINFKFIKSKIEKMFEPIKFRIYSENGDQILEISGRNIVWSEIAERFKEKYDPKIIDQIRISAIQELTLTDSLKFPGKNFSLIALEIIVPRFITLDLSGEEDTIENLKLETAAKSGGRTGENGENGEDGTAGKSSGNIVFCTSKITNEENLKLILNGVKGSNGQDGGNGAKGFDGIGVKFEDVFGFWRKAGNVCASVVNSVASGNLFRMLGGFRYSSGPNGTTWVISISTYKCIKISNAFISFFTKPFTDVISSSHALEYYEGTKGSKGGRGGQNGVGGEGGKKGTCTILPQGEKKEEVKVSKIEARDGIDGENGKPGKNGEYGKDGWDVGMTRKTLEFFKEYCCGLAHTEVFKVPLSLVSYGIVPWMAECNYSDKTLYVQERDTGDGSKCYAWIKTRECGRQVLKENEKMAEQKRDSERKADAIARKTNSININAIEEKYEGFCQAQAETAIDQEQEMEEETETEAQVNRIAETFDIPKEPLYIPKEKHEVPVVSLEVLNALEKDNPELWNLLWKATTSVGELTKLQLKIPDFLISEKFKIKISLTTLRHHFRSSKGEFAKTVKKFIQSQNKAEHRLLDVLRRQRMKKAFQNEVRNCSPFLIKNSENDEIIDACVGALMGNSSYSGILREAVEHILAEMVDVPLYTKYANFLSEFDKIQVNEKPIYELKLELMQKLKFPQSDKDEVDKMLKTACIKSKTMDDFKNVIKSLGDDTNKLIFVYNQLYEKVMANQILAETFKLTAKAQANEIQLDKSPELYGENSWVITWLTMANDKKLCELWKNYILKYGTKCAGGRLILAWETKVNLRIYNNGNLIEDHMASITGNVQHLEIDEKTGAFTPLMFKSDRIILEKERQNKILSFQKRLEEVENKFECPKLLPSEFVTVSEWCANCQKLEEGKLSLDQMDILKPKLENLLSFIGKNGLILYNQLETLCIAFPSIGVAFTNSILNVFEVDGCHIDFITFKYILETVIVSLVNHLIHNKYFFPNIIFSTEQSEWIDEFFIFNAENALMGPVARKVELQERLKKVSDENLKILCSFKLQTEKLIITPEELLVIVDVMKDAHGAYPELVEVELQKWPIVIKDSQIYYKLTSQKHSFLDVTQRNLALFWCFKLAAANFDIDEIEKVFAILGAQKSMEFDMKIFGQVIQRLCNNEIIAGSIGQKPSPCRIFAHAVSKFNNSCSPIPKSLEIRILRSDKEMAEELMGYSKNYIYSYQDWITILMKRNESSDLLSMIFEKFKKSNTQQYINAVTECVEMVSIKAYSSPTQYAEAFRTCFNQVDNEDFDAFLLVITSNIISKKRGYHLRLNQFVAALCAIRSKKGLLQQLATGEGKSLIVTALSIVCVLKGHRVNIVTSSPTLAKRDTECPQPVGCKDIYEAFGIKASHICENSPSIRSERYAENEIIYGDLTGFQRDYLLDQFYAMNIVGSRGFDVVIVDEVDSMLLDQGSNMLYLSHEIPDLEMLQSLFVKIWHIVNGFLEDTNGGFEDANLFQTIYRSIFPLFLLQHFADMLGISEDESEFFLDFLKKESIISDEGEILMLNKPQLLETLKRAKNIQQSTITRFIYSYDRVMTEERLEIPQHLQEYVKRHLKEFISNAKSALFMEEGVGYQVDMVHSDVATSFQPKIIIIDQGTGVDLPTTQWSNGLHQFLQLKHGLRLTAVSMKAVFTSNVSFLKMFGSIFGFSGTLGAAAERNQLSEMYDLQCLVLPSSLPKQFYEEKSIVATTKSDEEYSHVHQVFKALNKKMNEGRSVLVICESIKQVTDLSESVKKVAQKCLSPDDSKPFSSALLYRRDHEKFAYGDGTALLEPKHIIFSTNLAGRGTDIKLSEQLRNNGGLHVIVAFLPDNLRVEDQAFGRAARCGDQGTAQLIIYASEKEHGVNINIAKLKLKRNAQEIRRIQKITDYYNEKLLIEEKCFEHFSEQFKIRKKILDEFNFDDERNQLASRDLLDQWALWLDKTGYENLTGNERIQAAENFCKNLGIATQIKINVNFVQPSDLIIHGISKLSNDLGYNLDLGQKPDLILTQPLNVIKYAILETSNGNYEHAKNLFEWIIQNYPVYSPEAKYYLTFIYVKEHKNMTESKIKDYKKIGKLFEEARNGFEKRLFGYYNDKSIIEHYRKNEKSRIFKTDAFSQQQMELAQLMNFFIESIDVLFGGRIDSRDFATDLINEESSYLLHQYFTSKDNFDNPPIMKTKVREEFENDKLENYCQKRGISFENVAKTLKGFKKRKVDEKVITELMNPATVEKFWDELTKKELITDIQTHLFVNTSKYSTLNPELVKLIQEFEVKENQEIKDLSVSQSEKIIKNGDLKKESQKENGMYEIKNVKSQHRVFQYSFVNESGWKKLEKENFESKVKKSCINILLKIGAICYTESAELVEKNEGEISKIKFNEFSSIKKADILVYGIPSTEIDNILKVYVETKVLKLKATEIYELADIIAEVKKDESEEIINNDKIEEEKDLTKIPNCFDPVMKDILKQKLIFALTYRDLQEKLKANEILKITLPTFKESSPIFDLLDMGIIERSNIDFKALNKNSKTTGIIKSAWNYVMDNEASSNVSLAAKLVSKVCENNLKKVGEKSEIFLDLEKAFINGNIKDLINFNLNTSILLMDDDKIKHYKEITNNVSTSQFENLFSQRSPAIQRIETLDAKLIALWDKLGECNLFELRSSSLMVQHGATHLISLHEQKWSWKTIGKLALVTLGAIAQLALGGVILVYSLGTGAYVANFLISEGISDLIYVIKGACTGYADNYKQHKIMSMIASGVLCGVGGYFASGSQFNSVSHGIYGSGWTAAGVNNVALKGGALIAKASLKIVGKEVLKQIGRRVAAALLNLALFTALQQGLKYVIQEAISCTRRKIIENLKSVFDGFKSLKMLLIEVFNKFGIEAGKSLVKECGNHVLHGKSNDWMNEICDFVFIKYRHLFVNFGQGMADGMSQSGNPTAQKIQTILKTLPTIFLVTQFGHLVFTMQSTLKNYMNQIEVMIKAQFEQRKSVMIEEEEKEIPEIEATEKASDSIMEEWHKELGDIVDKTIESGIAMPLLAIATSALQRQIESLVARGYEAFKTKMDKEKLEKYKAAFETAKNAAGTNDEVLQAQKAYENNLIQLQRDTRSPEIYAKIITESVKIDQTGASAVANMVSNELGQPVIINIKNQNGDVYTHKAGEGNENVKTINIDLSKQHYGTEENSSRNSCLYDEIIKQVPKLQDTFMNDNEFRHGLADTFKNDPYFRQHIQNGWHSIAIEKGLIGGKKHNGTTGDRDKLSKSAERHTLPPNIINQCEESDEYSESCDKDYVTLYQNSVEKNRPQNNSNNSNNIPRTSFVIDPHKFDKEIKAVFDREFDVLKENNIVQEHQRSTYEMNIQIRNQVKGYEHKSGQLKQTHPQPHPQSNPQSQPLPKLYENPTFIVKGGQAVHYDHKNTTVNPRTPTKDGGPRTNYKHNQLKYERVP